MDRTFRKTLNLVKELAWNDFKLRYNRSVLGFFWSLLKPLLIFATLYVVFSIVFQMDIPHYQLFLLFGIVLWTYFAETTVASMHNLVGKKDLINKLYFPRELIVISSCLSASITFILNLFVFWIFMLIFDAYITYHAFTFFILLAELFILVLGLSFALSALYVLFRDLAHIWEVFLQIGFWITPIIYPLSAVPEKYLKWYMLNPMARIINDSRNAVIFHGLPSLWHMAITLIMCLAALLFGLWIFRRLSPRFADEI
ncbi:ABC transporter permease [Candidatus Woesearchaeota archaeon]|nr:ABC transporter permease [Candidatus Woesearchaeota archaeon]